MGFLSPFVRGQTCMWVLPRVWRREADTTSYVADGRLNRYVPQKKLDLLQFPSGSVAEPSTSPTQIVRCQLRHAYASGGFLHDVPNRLFSNAFSPCLPDLVDSAEQSSSINRGCGEPIV